MKAIEAIRAFEAKLVGIRTVAAANRALETYTDAMLPDGINPDSPFMGGLTQGFHAGYDAAMNAVRMELNGIQTAALRAENPGRESMLDELIASGRYREAFMPSGERVAVHIATEQAARGKS